MRRATDDSSLTRVGWDRAHRLVDLFDPTDGPPRPGLARPTAIYAAGANDDGEGQRTRETVAPLADRLGIAVNTDFGKGDEEKLVEDVMAQPGPTLICWQHGEIPAIADAFPGVTPTPPAEWPDDRFDVVWTLTRTADGWHFAQLPELVLPDDQPPSSRTEPPRRPPPPPRRVQQPARRFPPVIPLPGEPGAGVRTTIVCRCTRAPRSRSTGFPGRSLDAAGRIIDMSAVVIAVIVTALVFDFTNGFHDTANAMATSIATGALRPRTAVLLAGVLNLIGAFLSVQVALTISSGLVDETRITPEVIFGGLVGAILWNLLTWLLGLPSSSSHALFGGLIGATWVFAGSGGINTATVVSKVLVPLALSPIVAGAVALTATHVAYRIAARGERQIVTRGFRSAQVGSASMVALAHGTNDAQKTMGVITLTLVTVGLLPAHAAPPLWVVTACGLAIAAGHRRRWLADHPDPGPADQRHRQPAGFRGRDGQHRGHPELGAAGVRAVDHPGHHRSHPRCRRRPPPRPGPVGGGRRGWPWPGC